VLRKEWPSPATSLEYNNLFQTFRHHAVEENRRSVKAGTQHVLKDMQTTPLQAGQIRLHLPRTFRISLYQYEYYWTTEKEKGLIYKALTDSVRWYWI
jgi:hypothetical protein